MGGFNPEYDETLVEGDGVYDEYSLIEDERGVAIMADVAVTIGDYEISAGDTLRRADGTPVIGWKFPRGMSYIYDADNPSSSENDFGERNLKPDCAGFMAGRVLYSDPTSVDYYYENPTVYVPEFVVLFLINGGIGKVILVTTLSNMII